MDFVLELDLDRDFVEGWILGALGALLACFGFMAEAGLFYLISAWREWPLVKQFARDQIELFKLLADI